MSIIPQWLNWAFIVITFACLLLFLQAIKRNPKIAHYSRLAAGIIFFWMILQMLITLKGFYLDFEGQPPNFVLAIAPSIAFITILFVTKRGRNFIEALDLKSLTLLHIIRIPVELCLYGIFVAGAIPEVMTFAGRNHDIIAGLTAPMVWYFCLVKNSWSKRVLLVWNVLSLGLLTNIIVLAILSTPTPFQQFGFNQPNLAVVHFPYIWLPSVVVQLVIFSHLASIWKIIKSH